VKKYKILILAFFLFNLTHSTSGTGSKVVWEDLEWNVLKSEHFDIHYPKGYDYLGKTALLYAEEANILLSKKLEHNLSQVIPVFIYPSHSHFQMTNIIFENIEEGVGGFTERMKKRVVVPFMGSYDDFRHVITHELVHAFQYDLLLGGGFGGVFAAQYTFNPPLWLVEGMAEYFSIGWDETADMTIRDAVLTETLPSIIDMTEFNVMTGYMLYKGGQSVIHFIAETYGENKIAEFFKDIRDIKDLNDAVKTNFGISLKRFDNEWRLWCKRKFFLKIEKNVDEEEANLVSRHFEDKSFINLHPALSPDGKLLAYMTIRDFFPSIVIRKAIPFEDKRNYSLSNDKPDFDEKILITSGRKNIFYQLNILDNRISFSPDSKNIFFGAENSGKDHLFLYNIEKEKIVEKWTPPLDMIQYPRLSTDGKKAVFTGTVAGQTDIFILDLKTSELLQITFNLFSKRDPALNIDNSRVLFSANNNIENNFESTVFNIFEYNLKTQETKQLTFNMNKNHSPVYINDSEILYTSNENGIFNAYVLNLNSMRSKQITNLTGGVFEPQINAETKKMTFTMYRNQGYDIALKSTAEDKSYINKSEEKAVFEKIKYPAYPAGLSYIKPVDYNTRFSPDWLFFGIQYSTYFGFGGFLQSSLSDYLGNHQIHGYVDYLSKREYQNSTSELNILENMNFDINYGYLKKRMNFYVGFFRASNFFSIFNITDIATLNEILHNQNIVTEDIYRFGAYFAAEYPFSPFWSAETRLELSRYQETFYKKDIPEIYKRKDIFTNIQSLNLAARYNNVLYSFEGPLKGLYFKLQGEQTFNLSGNDFVYNREIVDFRYYFLFFNRFVLAYRLFAGNISGPQKEYFPWQIGGYNTIRAYPFLSMKASNAFFSNIEFRFPLIDAIMFGFPVPWIIRGFSGVMFLDSGTAFDNYKDLKIYDKKEKSLQDLKLSFGLGMRMVIFPGFLIKIDWGTPWNLKKALPISKWKGEFSLGYQY